jgi:phosphate transport system permease protein
MTPSPIVPAPLRKQRVRRQRSTHPSVRVVDRVARALITVGGIGTIVAVSVLCLFLVWVVVPLFLPPDAEPRDASPALVGPDDSEPVALGLDEYLSMGWALERSGTVRAFGLDDGAELARIQVFAGERPTALSASSSEERIVAGFADGTVRVGRIGFAARFVGEDELGEVPDLAPGERAPVAGGMLERTTGDQLRLQELSSVIGEPVAIATGAQAGPGAEGAEIRHVDLIQSTSGPIVAALSADHLLRIARARKKTNLLTGEETLTYTRGELALDLSVQGLPRWLLLSGLGDNVLLLWEDGQMWRCDARDLRAMALVEKTDLLPEDGVRVTAASYLIGRASLALGDSLGRIGVWFPTKPASAGTPDGIELARGHELGRYGAAVTALAPSARGRTLAAGYADGRIRLWHVTSQTDLVGAELPAGSPVTSVALAPKDDALLGAGPGGTLLLGLDVPHPEASPSAIFGAVWYEGYEAPAHVWQSSSGTDDFEPKYGLVPLVFGTHKATFYSLLFGVPLALLAAVYTSEFLHPRSKARIKPTIEMMASLPSVVLGFLAALVIAPLVEDVVTEMLVVIVAVPFFTCLGGFVWRALPHSFTVRYERFRPLPIAACLVLALAAGASLGPVVERVFFAGDIRQWLTGTVGSGTGGWIILLLPAVAIGTAVLLAGFVNPRIARAARDLSRTRFALLDLAKFLAAAAATLLVTWALGSGLDALGFDSRGGVLDTHVQRNALVVGFVMGFAIIPIVYTIAEDALAAVPDHLRAASLGAGATTWQTTVRVVVPTAMSGLFSAVMIGFGRAVGETMIVLMAAGNTPVMDWNVFNGFRTLSANIAVELPEAVQGSTHYRMLFLAALVLFAITFVLNTLAETVRLRYRKRRVSL